jgi:ribosome biogenesis GTPase
MSPKFSGDDEDEEQPTARHKASKKPIQSQAKTLSLKEGNGLVTEIFPNQSAVRLDGASQAVLCAYRMSTLAFGFSQRERSPVCVGDRVRVEAGVIVGRCERKNRLVRSAPNVHNPLLHVLASNLDCLVIVSSAREPEFSGGIIDRFLVAALSQKIEPILCVNKMDLIGSKDARPWSHYLAIGVPVMEISAENGQGTEKILDIARGKIVAFCGHSGVGKTSLLRRLLHDENYGKIGFISQASGKGRHTTTGASMILDAHGSYFIDTPGVMNFGLIDIASEDLLSHFPELYIAAAKCAIDCAHADEPHCSLRDLPRYKSYRSILGSLK